MKKYESEFIVKGNTLIGYTGISPVLIVPEGIERISSKFESKVPLETLILPKSLLCIEKNAFYKSNLNNMKTVKMYDSIEDLEENAFYLPIEHLEIRNTYGNAAWLVDRFYFKCVPSFISELKTIRITEKKLSEGEVKRILISLNKKHNVNLKLINDNYKEIEEGKRIEGLSDYNENNIPSTVEEIGYKASHKKMLNLTIPENVKIVSADALYDCGIEFLTIYDSLQKIFISSFGGNLKEITIINRGHALDIIKRLRKTHTFYYLETIKIVGDPLNLMELFYIKRLFNKKVKIKFQTLEETVSLLPESKEERLEDIKDKEVHELLSKIRNATKYWNNEQKENIEFKINTLMKEYKDSLEKSKNSFNIQETLELTPLSPSMLREKFLNKLENLYIEILSVKYNDLLVKIGDYEIWINKEISPYVPKEINSIEDKIKFIITNSNSYEKRYIENLKTIFESTKTEISNIILKRVDNIPVLILEDLDTKFEKKINELYLNVLRRKEIEETLNGKNQSSLGIDIKELLNIIKDFSKLDRDMCLEELSSIIEKYHKRLLENDELTLDMIELDLRKELLPFLAKIINIKPIPSLDKIKDKISNCLNLIDKEIIEETEDLTLNSIKEIIDLSNNENLTETEKETIKNKIKDILNNWQEKLQKEEDNCLDYLNVPDILMQSESTYKNEIEHLLKNNNTNEKTKSILNSLKISNLKVPERVILEDKNMQIELLILSELLNLKDKVEEKISRNIECARLLKSL